MTCPFQVAYPAASVWPAATSQRGPYTPSSRVRASQCDRAEAIRARPPLAISSKVSAIRLSARVERGIYVFGIQAWSDNAIRDAG
jgi:hypothetical protein